MLVADPEDDYRLLLCNAAARRLLGLGDKPLAGLSLPACIPGLMVSTLERLWRGLGDADSVALKIEVCRENRVVVIAVRFSRLEHEGGMLAGYLSDIDESSHWVDERAGQASFQETLLNAVADAGLQLMLIENGRIIHVGNRELAHEFGFTDAELDAHPALIDIIHPDDRVRIMDYHERRIAGAAAPAGYDMALLTRAGERRDYEVSAAIVPGSDPVRVITISKDISERKAAERRIRRVLSSLPGFIYTFRRSPDGHYSFPFVSSGIEDIYGLTPNDVKDDMAPLHALAHPDDAPRIEAALAAAAETLTPFRLELRVLRPGHPERWVECRSLPERDSDGGILWHGLMLDVTERKIAQHRMELLDRAIDLSSDAIFLSDEQFRFNYVNATACRVLGYSREDLLTMSPLDIDPDISLERMREGSKNSASGSAVIFESRHQAKDGRMFPVELSVSVFEDSGAKLNLTVARDITERKRTEDVLKFIAQGDWMNNGEAFLTALVCYLGRMLVVDYVIVDKLSADPGVAETVAIYAKGAVIPNMRYNLKGTPCENVLGGRLCCYPALVQQHFPDDKLLGIMQVESYAGLPLWDSQGQAIGLIAVMDGRPIGDTAAVASILQLVATSAAAELERRQSEQALAESRRFLSRIIDAIPDPVFVKDRAHRWVCLNQAYCDFMGYPMALLLGRSDSDFFPAHEAEVIRAKDEFVFKCGEELVNEEEFIDRNGNTHTIQTKKTCYTDEKGQQYLVGVIRDLSQRKQAENLLRQRERELRTLVENLPTMVVRYDRNFRRIYVNSAYTQITGRAESLILGKSADDAWRATNISAESYVAVLNQVMRSGRKTEVSLEWIGADGRLISHAMKIVPEYDADGQVSSVLALGFDLSDRRHRQIIEGERQRVFEKMAQGDHLDSILAQVALYVESSKSGRYCSILLLDEQGEYLQTVAAPSFPKSYRPILNLMLLSHKSSRCFGWVASILGGERVIVENIGNHPCWASCRSFISEIGAEACWSEPIFSATKQLLGVVTVYLNQAGLPDEDDLTLLLQAGHLCSIAIERKRIEQQMHHQASYDSLTGLPNRRLFGNRLREEIAKAERGAYGLAVLFIDLDRFKEVNDTMGHESGDLLLAEAAQRIQTCVRKSDTVARLGGDEFVVILSEVGEVFPQDRVAQAIVETMAEPFRLGAQHIYLSASIGIAVYPQDADNADSLIGCADQAMYVAKEAGRNSFNFFTRSMLEQAQQRLQVAAELRGALDKGQLEVFYQPIIEVGSGVAVKAEALLRWRHPEWGMVLPDRFIPIAEETDLIHEIGAWVFREAADMAKHWNELCLIGGVRQVSVNMSPRQFVRGNSDTCGIDYLQAIGLNPGAMVIEITEGLLLNDQAAVMDKLRCFHEAGLQVALDDFGTGYSAMAYLKKFNIDYLKIDRSFVRDLESDTGDRAIAEAIVVMAHRLGLKVIAEGVETEGQRNLLALVGCEYVQGYLYAKPMPAQLFFDYIAG